MARKPSGSDRAKKSDVPSDDDLDPTATAAEDEPDIEDEADDGDDADGAEEGARSAEVTEFWSEVRVEPVEIALPGGVGYTLRAYRLSTEVTLPDFEYSEGSSARRRADDEDLAEIDEEELTAQALAAGRSDRRDDRVTAKKRADSDSDEDEDQADDEDEEYDEDDDDLDTDAEGDDEDDEDDEEDEDDEVAEPEPEEVPVFLGHDRQLLLFRTPAGLVEYVRTNDDHDLAQLDTWGQIRERIQVEYVEPVDDNRYELDLIVKNLRGGHDAWDHSLIIKAGEIARDIGYALRIEAVVSNLSSGSPLDDLDEGLRSAEAGGFGAFFAKRRIRKIDAQTTAALGWRTVIGKISAAVDWRN